VKVPFFDLGAQLANYKGDLLREIEKVIDSGVFIGGESVATFERDFAKFIGTEHAVGVGNGLDAIRIILEALGIGEGDEVIVPAFTFYATWLAVVQVGAIPVFVDVHLADACIDESQIESQITAKTKAVLAVHLYGNVANLAEIKRIADFHGIHLIEDVAQAHGAIRDNLAAGSVGIASAFSFYPTKNLGALGDGGAIVTNSPGLSKKAISRRSYGIGESKYEHVDTGWNTRLDPIQAVILNLHLKMIESFTAKRRLIASTYLSSLQGFEDKVVGPTDVLESVWHHFVIRPKNRETFRLAMNKMGISTDVHYPYSANSVEPMRQYLQRMSSPMTNSQELSNSVVSLPIGPWMSSEQIRFVADALQELKNEL
jgi:dTDP-3-amino-3,4,6-trideoxy-alpha-D-glucose transaminase